jgi:hypothetical protein
MAEASKCMVALHSIGSNFYDSLRVYMFAVDRIKTNKIFSQSGA